MSEREREEEEEEVSASIMAGSRALGQHNVCETRSLERPPLHGSSRGREKESSDAMRDAGWVKMKRRALEERRVEV